MTTLTRNALWVQLGDAGLVTGEIPTAGEARSPWFVRAMLGIAGWIGAFFLLLFVGAGFAFIIKSSTASFIAGACVCAAAAALFRAGPKNDFLAQFGLAVSLAGQALMVAGAVKWFEGSGKGLALYIALQQGLLFVLVPNFVHRLWASLSCAMAATYAMVDAGLYVFTPAVTTAVFAFAALSEFKFARQGEMLRAGVYGLALTAVATAVLHGHLAGELFLRHASRLFELGEAGVWLGRVASLAVLVGAVLALLRREGLSVSSGQGRVGLAAALILGAASIKAPGVGPAAAILIVGYANADRVLTGLGIAALLGYLSHYYYSLQATLLEKAALLAATGLALLAARLAMRHWWPAQPAGEAGHA